MGRSALQFLDILCVSLQVASPSLGGVPPVMDVHHLVRIGIPLCLGCGLGAGHHDLVPNLKILVFGFLPHVKVSLVLLRGSLVSLPGRLVLAAGLGWE